MVIAYYKQVLRSTHKQIECGDVQVCMYGVVFICRWPVILSYYW